jgi:hypothetical protein
MLGEERHGVADGPDRAQPGAHGPGQRDSVVRGFGDRGAGHHLAEMLARTPHSSPELTQRRAVGSLQSIITVSARAGTVASAVHASSKSMANVHWLRSGRYGATLQSSVASQAPVAAACTVMVGARSSGVVPRTTLSGAIVGTGTSGGNSTTAVRIKNDAPPHAAALDSTSNG